MQAAGLGPPPRTPPAPHGAPGERAASPRGRRAGAAVGRRVPGAAGAALQGRGAVPPAGGQNHTEQGDGWQLDASATHTYTHARTKNAQLCRQPFERMVFGLGLISVRLGAGFCQGNLLPNADRTWRFHHFLLIFGS